MATSIAGGHFVNDKSEELISLYRAIKNQDCAVFDDLERINASWKKTFAFIDEHPELKGVLRTLQK
jgi:hypothetical protein